MDKKNVLSIYRTLQKKKDSSIFTTPLSTNPLKTPPNNKRPNSISIEDGFFGDSGKGRVTAEFNHHFRKKKQLLTLRFNGGANAGHECVISGKHIVTHQLPIGIIQENTINIIGRGALIHPKDLVTEIDDIKGQFGGKLPGKLLIDERAPLGLDTHRAFETVLNTATTGGRGSTGRGIAAGYASVYERIAVTVKDLFSPQWKNIFSAHYRLYRLLTLGFGKSFDLATIPVAQLGQEKKQPVGSEKEFLGRLAHTRFVLQNYISSTVYALLCDIWSNPTIPVVIEGAQGAGLDPYHGVYPDVTASRPTSRSINDATYNIIMPEAIALRAAVMKTTYMSSVGKRKLPTQKNERYEKWVQETFDEKGRSTGRLRDIYPVSIPIASYLKKAAGYEYLIATHLDAAKTDTPINVVSHYTNHVLTKEKPYLPYQDYLDELEAHTIAFPSWDGTLVKSARSPKDLPFASRLFLSFLSQTIAPVILGTTDLSFGSVVSWLPV